MEMIDRYLQAVKFALPQAEREDIVKELRDSILSQIEEKEAMLGRTLSEDEQAELLKKLGSPMQLASRYRKQQYLIGATMFPIYWKVLKVSLTMVFVVLAGGSIATAAAGKSLSESLAAFLRFPSVALLTFAWLTVVFSALEFFGARLHLRYEWDPRKLPPLVKAEPTKSQFELITQLVVQTFFAIWWLVGLHYQYLILGPGVALLRFGPVWQTIYPLFVVMVIVDFGLTALRLVWPRWIQGPQLKRLAMSALGLIVLYFLVGVPDLFVSRDPASPQLQSLAKTISLGVHVGLIVALIANVYNVVKESVRFISRRFGSVHQATVGG